MGLDRSGPALVDAQSAADIEQGGSGKMPLVIGDESFEADLQQAPDLQLEVELAEQVEQIVIKQIG